MKIQHFFLSTLILCGISSAFATPTSYLVYDFQHNKVLEAKNSDEIRPIASLTKLMTAHTFLKYNKNNTNCTSKILSSDHDTLKHTRTRLPKNVDISCDTLLKAMLISSDNYAASALSHAIPNISKERFIQLMNKEAKTFKMMNTHFMDSSGLSPLNTSTAEDLMKLVKAVKNNKHISEISSTAQVTLKPKNTPIEFRNTNKLVRYNQFDGQISKTGYTAEAGYNLIFLPKTTGKNHIGVICLNSQSPDDRLAFTRNKLNKYNK